MKKLLFLLFLSVMSISVCHAQQIYEGELMSKDGSLYVVNQANNSKVLLLYSEGNWTDENLKESLDSYAKAYVRFIQTIIPDGTTEIAEGIIKEHDDERTSFHTKNTHRIILIPSSVKKISSGAFSHLITDKQIFVKVYPTGQQPQKDDLIIKK